MFYLHSNLSFQQRNYMMIWTEQHNGNISFQFAEICSSECIQLSGELNEHATRMARIRRDATS